MPIPLQMPHIMKLIAETQNYYECKKSVISIERIGRFKLGV